MATPSAGNVSVAKPHGEGGAYAGGFWYAPAGTVVPTDATTPLPETFVSGGYLSDDGITNSRDRDDVTVNAFGGDLVLSATSSVTETVQFGLLETTYDALALVYGTNNVTKDTSGNITVKHNAKDPAHIVGVVELALTGDRVKRIVLPDAQVGDVDDVEYQDGEAITYTPTLSCYPDAAGNFAYEYIAKVAASPSTPTSGGSSSGESSGSKQ